MVIISDTVGQYPQTDDCDSMCVLVGSFALLCVFVLIIECKDMVISTRNQMNSSVRMLSGGFISCYTNVHLSVV